MSVEHTINLGRRLSVLLLTSYKPFKKKEVRLYADDPPNNIALMNHIDLLSACNIPWETLAPEEISREAFISDGIIKYAVVIIEVPLASLSDRQISILKTVSYEYGISLIGAYDAADIKSESWFGIDMVTGERLLWPLKVKILEWPCRTRKGETIASYGLTSALPGLRKAGFGKLSLKETCAKGVRLFKSIPMRYRGMTLKAGARILSTTMKGEPIAWSFGFGAAVNYYFALDDKKLLGKFNEMHRLMHYAIAANSGHGMTSVCLDGAMVLRLDDPGASKADHLRGGSMMKEQDWRKLGLVLKREKVPMSVMYTPGWLDDGDPAAGALFLDCVRVDARKAGDIHDSPRVAYSPSGRREIHDHSSEYAGLKGLLEDGCIDIHSHGLTHTLPDHAAWAASPDRHRDTDWYHEFFDLKRKRPVAKELQEEALRRSRNRIEDLFKVSPYAFTPSGHRHDAACDLNAQQAGYALFSSDYTGISKENVLIRNRKIVSLFLYFKEPTTFVKASGYPVIGVVHDYEIKNDLRKFEKCIQKWRKCGIERFLTFKDLIASLCSTITTYYSSYGIETDLMIHDKISEVKNFTLEGALVKLTITTPGNADVLEYEISSSNGTIISIENHNGKTDILLRLDHAPSYKIRIPLRTSGDCQLKTSEISFPDWKAPESSNGLRI